jgi:hypothetical protein
VQKLEVKCPVLFGVVIEAANKYAITRGSVSTDDIAVPQRKNIAKFCFLVFQIFSLEKQK